MGSSTSRTIINQVIETVAYATLEACLTALTSVQYHRLGNFTATPNDSTEVLAQIVATSGTKVVSEFQSSFNYTYNGDTSTPPNRKPLSAMTTGKGTYFYNAGVADMNDMNAVVNGIFQPMNLTADELSTIASPIFAALDLANKQPPGAWTQSAHTFTCTMPSGTVVYCDLIYLVCVVPTSETENMTLFTYATCIYGGYGF